MATKEAKVPDKDSLFTGTYNFGTVTSKINDIVTGPTGKGWVVGFAVSFLILQVLLMAVTWLLYEGIGTWGVNVPVGWGFDIINFVWWIGIGHAAVSYTHLTLPTICSV